MRAKINAFSNLDEVHVDFVDVGPLLPVNLHVDVVLVHDGGTLGKKLQQNDTAVNTGPELVPARYQLY